MPRQKIQMTEQAYQARLQYYESLEREAQDRLEAVRRDAKNDVERYRMAYEEMKKNHANASRLLNRNITITSATAYHFNGEIKS